MGRLEPGEFDVAESDQLEKTVDVFISYSRRDKVVADRVHQRVTQRGLSCFYDTRSINVGDLWRDELYGAIMSARTMILLISRNSLDSKEVLRETNKAINYETMICPIVLGDVDRRSKLCRFVDEYHWLESKETPSDAELDLLVERVAAIVGVDRKVPEVTVLAPLGGETFQPGETYRLAWSISVPLGTSIQQIGMELMQNGVPVYAFPGKESPWAGSVRECAWTVPTSLASGRYQVRLHAINNLGHVGAAESAQPITIVGKTSTIEIPPSAAPESAPQAPAPVSEPVVKPPVSAVIANLRVIEPAAKARWTRGRTEVIRLEATTNEQQSLSVELVPTSGTARTLATLTALELRAKISQSAGGAAVLVPVVIPLLHPLGPATLQVTLKREDGASAAQSSVIVDICASSAAAQVSQFEQDECIGAGIGFTMLCALGVAGILLLRQCQPIVTAMDWNSLNVSLVGRQLAEASWAVVWQNLFIVPVTAIGGGVLVASGSLIWASNSRRWLGGALVGLGWGAGVGLALSALGAEGPQAPARYASWPLGRDSFPSESPLLKTDPLVKPGSGGLLGNQEPGSKVLRLFEGTKTTPPASSDEKTPPLENRDVLTPKSGDAVNDPAQKLADKTAAELFQLSDSPSPQQTENQKPPPQLELPPRDPLEESKRIQELLRRAVTVPSMTPVDPDWHKVPVAPTFRWVLWGALIGAAIGCVSPLLSEKS